ncbi:MAG: hypothetical protein GXZ01_06655 [Clostridiaceae bacterium]|jgi:uncharacterized protein|nr:hypothetical protein [Clostridiaceae bacterium]
MRALKELSVLFPLRECGFAKEEIRCRPKEAALFAWGKPARARLNKNPGGKTITKEKLVSATVLRAGYMAGMISHMEVKAE